MNYRRIFIPGANYFFTLTLEDRQSDLLVRKINQLRSAFHLVKKNYPFIIDAIVILPEHLHFIMTLPSKDFNYSQRIGFIKSTFSRQIQAGEPISASKKTKRERGIWQRRFWEHMVRDELDLARHIDYIHYNPVKHGHVDAASQWQYSSIHRYIKNGILPVEWAFGNEVYKQEFGE